MKITNCRVNHMDEPLGFFMDTPVFSWNIVGCENSHMKLFTKIEIVSEGKMCAQIDWTELDNFQVQIGLTLKPRTKYQWQVSVRNEIGEEANSVNYFETGKLCEEWRAKWITCDKEESRHPIFEKTFNTKSSVKMKRARLYICGLGLYEVYVNGQRLGEEYLAPGCVSYNHYVQSYTYDATEQVKVSGQNIIAVLLGDGWYKGRFDFEHFTPPFYGDSHKLIAELHVEYEDGTTEVIFTDESWKVKRSNIVFSGIYDGEIVDDTLEKMPEENVFLVREKMPPLRDRLSLPVRTHEEFTPDIIRTPKGEMVLDIGQNMAGIFTLRVNEPKGTKIHLQFGEVLQDGCFYRDNLRTAKAEYVYISDGNEHILRPHFTYYGYRYVLVKGIENLKASDFKALALYSDVNFTCTLTTGNSKINRLIENCIWGMKSNFVDIPTDCPQRDERMGWTGDAQVFSETACILADTYPFYRKYLYDMSQEQKARNGIVPDVVPAFRMKRGSSVWGDATCIIPWNMYLSTGDSSILKEHYDSMVAWVKHMEVSDGTEHKWREGHHYGDWLALDNMQGNAAVTKGATDEGFIADVFYRISVQILAKTASILGKQKEALEYEMLAESILKGIQDEFYSPTGRCCFQTQTAAALTLKEGLHNEKRAVEMLRQCLKNSGGKLTTGFVGTPILCQVLSEHGMATEAFRLLLNEEYPGWLYEVNLGATTIWERWNSLDKNGHISSTGMNSLNHYTYGSIFAWIFKSVAGLRICEEKPGYQEVEIKPMLNWDLKYMKVEYASAFGTYRVEWKIKDLTHVYVRIEVPYKATARVVLPLTCQNEIQLNCGIHTFEYETEEPIAKSFSVKEHLRELMAHPQARSVLKEQVQDVEYISGYAGEYPLEETLKNLNYPLAVIDAIDEKLQMILF